MYKPVWKNDIINNNGQIFASRATEQSCLPVLLQTTVPSCALSCIQDFVRFNYSNQSCSSTADLPSLCTTKTNSGFTIGEGSLRCVLANCPGANLQINSGYNICSGVPGAIANQATVITVTITTMTSSSRSSVVTSTPTTIVSSTSSDASSVSTINSASSTLSSSVTDMPSASLTQTVVMSIGSSETSLVTSTTETTDVTPSSITTPTSSSIQTSSAQQSVTTNTIAQASSSTSSVITMTSRSTSSTPTLTSKNSTQRSSSTPGSTDTAVPVVTAPSSGLSTSALAGIITISIIVGALVIGYMIWWFVLRRNNAKRDNSRALPATESDEPPRVKSALLQESGTNPIMLAGFMARDPGNRFYAGENRQGQKSAIWQTNQQPFRSTFVDTSEGAITQFKPNAQSRSVNPVPANTKPELRTARPSSSSNMLLGTRPEQQRLSRRASDSTTFSVNSEPPLENVSYNSPDRLLSSVIVPAGTKPALGTAIRPSPLDLSKARLARSLPSGPYIKPPMTPNYDNGNVVLGSTIRQVPTSTTSTGTTATAGSNAAVSSIALTGNGSPNFSRRVPGRQLDEAEKSTKPLQPIAVKSSMPETQRILPLAVGAQGLPSDPRPFQYPVVPLAISSVAPAITNLADPPLLPVQRVYRISDPVARKQDSGPTDVAPVLGQRAVAPPKSQPRPLGARPPPQPLFKPVPTTSSMEAQPSESHTTITTIDSGRSGSDDVFSAPKIPPLGPNEYTIPYQLRVAREIAAANANNKTLTDETPIRTKTPADVRPYSTNVNRVPTRNEDRVQAKFTPIKVKNGGDDLFLSVE